MRDVNDPVIVVTGSSGQVGFELLRSLQGLGRVLPVDRARLDLTDLDQIVRVVREVKPALIINAGAYTAVDKAESDAAVAIRVNGDAPGVLADEARKIGAALIHYSTDYVFDGKKAGAYSEADTANPLNVYGRSKLAGERAIAQAGNHYLVLRTSWVYGVHGRNFLRTMLRLASQRKEVGVVADQIGAPTWSGTIAVLTAHLAREVLTDGLTDHDWWSKRTGIYHLTAAGSTSWAGFAEAIFEIAGLTGQTAVKPIASHDYPSAVVRPTNSLLSNDKLADVFGLRAPQWKEALALCMNYPEIYAAFRGEVGK
jgi:dTDP-4-dehydrorhamnose reductase